MTVVVRIALYLLLVLEPRIYFATTCASIDRRLNRVP